MNITENISEDDTNNENNANDINNTNDTNDINVDPDDINIEEDEGDDTSYSLSFKDYSFQPEQNEVDETIS